MDNETRIEDLEIMIEELKRQIRGLTSDINDLYGRAESTMNYREAIKEIQELLERDGYWFIRKVR